MCNRMARCLLVAGALAITLPAQFLSAAAPNLLNYQGRLTNNIGSPVADGQYRVEFSIYSTDTGGTALWSEIQMVDVAGGLFAVLLGSTAPITPSLFADSVRYLGVRVDPDPEIQPRTRIAAVAYALATAGGGSGGSNGWQDDGTAVHTTTNTDLVGIGTTSPTVPLHVVESNSGIFVSRFESGSTLATASMLANTSVNATWESAVSGSSKAFGLVPQGSMYFYLQGTPRPNLIMKPQGKNVMGAFDAPPGNQSTLYVRDSSYNASAIRAEVSNASAGALTAVTGIAGPNTFNNENYSTGIYGTAGDYGTGGNFDGATGVRAHGLRTTGTASAIGVDASASHANGADAYGVRSTITSGAGNNWAVWGQSSTPGSSIGVRGDAYGTGINIAIYGSASGGSNNKAGQFFGDVNIQGNLFKSSGAFRIDHPLDPANKYLQHSFVESPDMKNIYDGVVVLSAGGRAEVSLPAWFDALNKDFRYQLTCIGGYAPVYIEQEIVANKFTIAGGKSGLKVSWMVTGVRKDVYANANRLQVEIEKRPGEKGRFLHPELRGGSRESAIGFAAPRDDSGEADR